VAKAPVDGAVPPTTGATQTATTAPDPAKQPAKPEPAKKDEPPPVPKSLVTKPSTLAHISEALSAEIAKTASGTVIFQAETTDPATVTASLLASHPSAKLDPTSGSLTLPAVPAAMAEKATSLAQLGQMVAAALGVSKVTIEKVGDKFVVHGHINPGGPAVQGMADADIKTADDFKKVYSIDKAKEATSIDVTRLDFKEYLAPQKAGKAVPAEGEDKFPGYVVNMTALADQVAGIGVGKYADAAWAGTPDKASAVARTGVVIGVNGVNHLDATADQAEADKINAAAVSVKPPPSLSVTSFGFMWAPAWKHKDKGPQSLAEVRKAFANVNAGEQAGLDKDMHSGMKGKKQLPYGIFREEVLGSHYNQNMIKHVGTIADPVHILSQDNDGGVITASKDGVFTQYDKLLTSMKIDPLLTIGGYTFDRIDSTPAGQPRIAQFTALGNELDRAIRAAIAKIYPQMLYPTEPNSLLKATDKKNGGGIFDSDAQKAKLQPVLDNKDTKRTGQFFGKGATEGAVARESIRKETPGGFDGPEQVLPKARADEAAMQKGEKPAEDTSEQKIVYHPAAGTPTSSAPEDPKRELTVTSPDVRKSADGELTRGGDPIVGKDKRVSADTPTGGNDEKTEKPKPDRQHPMTAVTTQSQSTANRETLSRELVKGSEGVNEKDMLLLNDVFDPVEGAQRALADQPGLTADSPEIQDQLQAVEENLALQWDARIAAVGAEEKAARDKAHAAYELAALIAKRIIRALTEPALKEMWAELSTELKIIQDEAATAARQKKEAERLEVEKTKAARAVRLAAKAEADAKAKK
jgi:hypothetical protein